MMAQLHFASPLLLVGLAAAAIPVVLHLLSAVRAPEVPFPTLRFLRVSMQKTARRRRLEHWLLLLVRSLLLAGLAMAVAEPMLRHGRGFLGGEQLAAVLIVDNSYSMTARSGPSSALEAARRQAAALLGGVPRPALAAVMLSNDPTVPRELQTNLEELRDRLARAAPASGRAALAPRIRQAAALLKDANASQKVIYLFTDLQASSLEGLRDLGELAESGACLLVVHCAAERRGNVGVVDLQVRGERVVDRPRGLEISATLLNSDDQPARVNVSLDIDGRSAGAQDRLLPPRGRAVVRFTHPFSEPGPHVGAVVIDSPDCLSADNVRRFAVDLAGKIDTLLVRGQAAPGGPFDAARPLLLSLDAAAGAANTRWPIRCQARPIDQFGPEALEGMRAVFFADVEGFTPAQAQALRKFVEAGGTAAFFLGPAARPDAYNRLGPLLPGRVGPGVGQAGVTATALRAALNLSHRYLEGLYETAADYPAVLVQRYYRLDNVAEGTETVLAAPDGDPLLLSRGVGAGRVVLAATTASPEWNNLSTTPLLLAMVARMCLQAAEASGADHTHPAGAVVEIRPRVAVEAEAVAHVSTPGGTVETVGLSTASAGAVGQFAATAEPGVYRWSVGGEEAGSPGASGAFVTNLDGAESDLSALAPEALTAAVTGAEVYVAESLDAVHATAAAAASGEHIWDRFAALVILLLVAEAMLANRFRRPAEPARLHQAA